MSTTMHVLAEKQSITFDYRVVSVQFDSEGPPQPLKPGKSRPVSMVVSFTPAAGWEAVVHYVTAAENGPVLTCFYSEHRDTLARIGGRVAAALSEVTEGAWPQDPEVTEGAWPQDPGPVSAVAADSLGDGGASS